LTWCVKRNTYDLRLKQRWALRDIICVLRFNEEAPMAKAGLLFVGTDDGIVLFSDPGGVGRWLRIGQELRGQAVRAVWPAADTPLVVLAAVVGAGLQRSEDGGQTWRQAFDADIRSLAGHPRDPQALFLGTANGDIYHSVDGGANWQLTPPDGRPAAGVARIAVAADDPQRLYAGLDTGGVWVSADGSASWTAYGAGLSGAITDLANAPDALYALAEGMIYRCASADTRWEQIEAGEEPGVALATLAGKQPVLLLARRNAIARSADSGATWAMAEPQLSWEGDLTIIAAVRYHIDMALAGTDGGQLAQSDDRGRSWQILKQGLPPIRSIAAARLA
jgi:photosystem II stability/assembly factor-like uncharacterized protein